MNSLSYAVAVVAVVILGLSKGGFAGIGMISTPLLAIFIGPVQAAGFILPILIVQDVVAVWMYRDKWSRRIIATMVPGAALGVWSGYFWASSFSESLIEITLGVISIVFAFRQLLMSLNPATNRFLPQSRFLGVFAGIASGFTSTIAHAGTPPFQFYVMPQKLDRDTYIGTSAVFFAILNLIKLPAFLMLGQLGATSLTNATLFAPLAILSSLIGVSLVRRIDLDRFNRIIAIILIGVGIGLIVQGILPG